jgi:glycerophosphoryl diester phosphodiesterase
MNLWLETRTRPLIVGHRGASAHAPENTLIAFRLAREQGADAIELDAKRCASGDVVIMHDATLDRTTNGDGGVHEWSLAELRTLDAGKGERIPTLDEVLEEVGRYMLVNVEVTNYTTRDDGLEAAVVTVVRRHRLEQRALFSSFNPLSVRKLAALAPDVPRAILYSADMPLYLRNVWLGPFVRHEFRHPDHTLVTPEMVQQLGERNLRVNTWTVNEPEEIKRTSACRVHGIIGDSPTLIRKTLGF